MFSFKKATTTPVKTSYKCDNRKCNHGNAPKPVSGTYTCSGCSRGKYTVSNSQAIAMDTAHRQPYVYPATPDIPVPSSSRKAGDFNPNAMVRSPPPRHGTVNQSLPSRDQLKAEQRMAKNLSSWEKQPLLRSNAVKRTGSGDSRTTSSTHAHAYGHSNIPSHQNAHPPAYQYPYPVRPAPGDSRTTSSTRAHAYGHSNIPSHQNAHHPAHQYSYPVKPGPGWF